MNLASINLSVEYSALEMMSLSYQLEILHYQVGTCMDLNFVYIGIDHMIGSANAIIGLGKLS